MEYLIGSALAAAVCIFALLTGFDRDRVFYPTVVAVNATYYILFAVMGGSTQALVWEGFLASHSRQSVTPRKLQIRQMNVPQLEQG